MCALFGFLDYGKRVPWKVLQKMVQTLANASEVRGHHAAGIAYNRPDRLSIFKRPKPAHKLHFHVPENTTTVMGHTRLTTQGDQKHNFNNHPFRGFAGTEFALAHNGVLYNDELLRFQLQLSDTQIETDSYIAVQLIESQKELTFDSMRYAAEKVRGYFTFTLLDRADNLYFIKGESPIYLVHFPSLGLYVYSSTKEIMAAAFKQIPAQFFDTGRSHHGQQNLWLRTGIYPRAEYRQTTGSADEVRCSGAKHYHRQSLRQGHRAGGLSVSQAADSS